MLLIAELVVDLVAVEVGTYSNDKTSIIPTNDLYLVGVLNSKVSDFVIQKIASTKQGGYYEYKPMYVSQNSPSARLTSTTPTT